MKPMPAAKAHSSAQLRWAVAVLSMALIVVSNLPLSSAQDERRINVLLMGGIGTTHYLHDYFRDEPLIRYTPIPCRGVPGGDAAAKKMIRLYFPRTYEEMQSYDFIWLRSPEYYYFTTQQDKMMYDAVTDGAGGINDASVLSMIAQLNLAWATSLLQTAFPNEAPVVAEKGGGVSPVGLFMVVINRDFEDPVLTPFIPFGVEKVSCDCGRFVIARETAKTMAWQVGNFPAYAKVPYLIVWDYQEGRTMTTGDCGGSQGWIRPPKTSSDNLYAPDIVVNLILYGTKSGLIEDVEVYHRIKTIFTQFRTRMAVLISLKEFVDKFGANTEKAHIMIRDLEEMGQEGRDHYMDQEFVRCEESMNEAFDYCNEVEAAIKKLKDEALLWVYVIEWAVTTSVLILSSFVLWTLMVRRRLYRAVKTTRME